MANYRYLFSNFVTGRVIGELPLVSCEYSTVLNDVGAFTGILPMVDSTEVPDVINEQNLKPGKTVITVERDGVPLWSGPLWTANYDSTQDQLTLNAQTWLSFYNRRAITTNFSYTEDQCSIVKAIVDYVNNATNWDSSPNPNVSTALVGLSGTIRTVTYNAYEMKNAGQAITDAADNVDAFDFWFTPVWSGNQIVTMFNTSYPAGGTRTNNVFHIGGNAEFASLSIDATTQANFAVALGAGDGVTTLIAQEYNATAGFPRFDEVDTYSDVSDSSTLYSKANFVLQQNQYPMVIPSLNVLANADPQLGSYNVGDICYIEGTAGIYSLGDYYRITTIDVKVDDTGSELVTIDFAPEDVFPD